MVPDVAFQSPPGDPSHPPAMTDADLLAAYRQARTEYDEAKSRDRKRPEAFARFLGAEQALVSRLGAQVYAMFR
jgi:hypothetical protein